MQSNRTGETCGPSAIPKRIDSLVASKVCEVVREFLTRANSETVLCVGFINSRDTMQRPGFGHARTFKQDEVKESMVIGAIKLTLPLMLFPLAMIAAFYKFLPLMVACMTVSVSLGIAFAIHEHELFIGLGRPPLEDAADQSLFAARSQLFRGLRGKVLDLSPHSAYILNKYYSGAKNKVSSVTTFEPNELIRKYTTHRAAKMHCTYGIQTRVIEDKTIDQILEATLEEEGEGSQDVIVSYSFLNRVKDIQVAIKLIHTLLKPGGTLIFMENDAYPDGSLDRTFQNVFNRLYRSLTNGAECTREITLALKQQEGLEVTTYSLDASDISILANLKLGYAIKKA